ncbi:Sensors of blue-light using FAD [Mucilaginibacter gossypiicola]|uniref:Sensors of blue-light using FAD n=1 Tax=Mucilaginibacter gossypiicola TaxID=551995 RepID=A0A1H8LHB9_9SPHI|nr:BLUF domain-containing protein [Mucilaginibacter gossypiicola]SEO04592.1 Sensors of blue-light using FAD [Mucilaginibacter gossypiicola]
MEYLVFISTAKKLMSDDELLDLLQSARLKNTENNITGMLLYGEGTFMQVLEGEKEDLQRVYNYIQADKRHRNIIVMLTGMLNERIFSKWSMSFASVNADVLEMIEGYSNPANMTFTNDTINHPTVTMIKTFADSNRLSTPALTLFN